MSSSGSKLVWILTLLALLLRCQARDYFAASASYADVANKVAQATAAGPNNVVYVPAGGAIWTKVLTVSNGLTLVGAGTNLTYITNQIPLASPWSSSLRPPLIEIKVTNDAPVRVTHFYFECQWTRGGQGIFANNLQYSFNPPLHALRVDHCTFHRANSRAIEIEGSIYGVIDHCLFQNCDLSTEPVCGHGLEWAKFSAPYFGLGTTNTIVIEDSVVEVNTEATSFGAPIAAGQGGHYVWRFNLTTNSSNINIDGNDLHGNNYYSGLDAGYRKTPQPGWRGSIWAEIYGNTIKVKKAIRSMKLRGGTCLVFSNAFWGPGRDDVAIVLSEEESFDAKDFNPLRTAWPAQDQITNTFIWGNTINGVASNYYRLDPGAETQVAVFIQTNRDIFLRAPTTGDAISRYTPLVYPHPLVTIQPSYDNARPPFH